MLLPFPFFAESFEGRPGGASSFLGPGSSFEVGGVLPGRENREGSLTRFVLGGIRAFIYRSVVRERREEKREKKNEGEVVKIEERRWERNGMGREGKGKEREGKRTEEKKRTLKRRREEMGNKG